MIRFCKGPVRPSQDFLHVPAASGSPQSVELLAQVRPSGRILDASRVVIGGDEVIAVDVNLFNAVPSPRLAGWKLRYQTWPRDIVIRRNQATSAWIDLEALIAGRDAEVLDREGAGIPANEVLGLLGELESPNAAALRWAVVLGDDSELHLQLKALPASAPVLNGKPVFESKSFHFSANRTTARSSSLGCDMSLAKYLADSSLAYKLELNDFEILSCFPLNPNILLSLLFNALYGRNFILLYMNF